MNRDSGEMPRRAFLRKIAVVGAGAGAAAMVAACGGAPATVTVEPGPGPEQRRIAEHQRWVLAQVPLRSELRGGMFENYNLAKFMPEKAVLDGYYSIKDPTERMLAILRDNPPQAASDDRTRLVKVETWDQAGGLYWCNGFAQKIIACYLYPRRDMSTYFEANDNPYHVFDPYDQKLASGALKEISAIHMFGFFMNNAERFGFKRVRTQQEMRELTARGGVVYGVKNYDIPRALGQEPDRWGHNFVVWGKMFLSQASDPLFAQIEGEDSNNTYKLHPEVTVKVKNKGKEEDWPKIFCWGHEFVG